MFSAQTHESYVQRSPKEKGIRRAPEKPQKTNPIWHHIATHTGIQPKLTVGASNDEYEQEADAVSAKVMHPKGTSFRARMPAEESDLEESPQVQTKPLNASSIQRDIAENEEELDEGSVPEVQTKPLSKSSIQRDAIENEEDMDEGGAAPSVQTKSTNTAARNSPPNSVKNTIRSPGGGSPLNKSVRSRVEPVLGADLSNVRVHSGAAAHEASQSLSARAFTYKNHVYLGASQKSDDVSLMAHELTHVVQQGAGKFSLHTKRVQPYIASKTKCTPYSNYHTKALNRLDKIRKKYSVGEKRLPALKRFSEEIPEKEKGCLHQRLSKTRKDAFTDFVKNKFPKTRVAFLNAINPDSPKPIKINSGQTRIQSKPAKTLPGYSQKGDTCGAASLVSAMMIWDRQRNKTNAPNDIVVTACNIVLTYLTQYRRRAVKEWNNRGLDGKKLHKTLTSGIKAIRDHARLPGSQISEREYQVIGLILYTLYLDGSAGLSASDISNLQYRLGLETNSSNAIQSFDDIFTSSIITGLKPGQIAQVGWYVKTGPPDSSGNVPLGMHAFLIGRLKNGDWFLSDQGPSPAREILASGRAGLEMAIRIAVNTDGYWLLTSRPTTFIVGGWTGVKLLKGPAGVENKAASIVKSGEYLGEVDAGWAVTGNKLYAGAFFSRHYSLSDAAHVNTGSYSGLIVEMPKGVFSHYLTGLVSDYNLQVNGLDTGDSAGGLLMKRTFYHAWLRLCSKNLRRTNLLKIY